jgi:tRNA A-37 threonylcarbamoyl transferase component Bud32
MIAVGETVGNYRVTAKLGEGGMGQVFLAEHPVIGSKVAIKAVHSQYARNPEVVSRFVTEARAVNQVGHDHIVDITDFGTTPAGDFYFVMEYLQGAMLAEQIGQAFPPARALNIAAQIADALQASHDQGVIHRDLKPANVLLITREGTPDFVKVFDFGLAKLIGNNGTPAAHHTGAGIVMGTPFYMSPEQCVGDAEVDHRCDIYALGVILFEMLTGRVPFTGEGYGDVLYKQVNQPAQSVRSLVPSLPPALDALVARALVKDPKQRFQTMAELRAALLEIEATLSAPAVTPRPRLITPTGDVLAGTGELIHSADIKPKKRHRGLMLAGAAALAMVALANVGFRRQAARVVAGTPAVAAATVAAPTPATVRVNFSSDPDGATVAGRDGTVLGVTPLSTDLAYSESTVEVLIQKAGYAPKTVAFVPNMPIPVLAVLKKQPAAGQATADTRPAAADSRSHTVSRARPARVSRKIADPNGDDILPPSKW